MALNFPIFATGIGTAVSNVYTVPTGGVTLLTLCLTNTSASLVSGNISYLNPDTGTIVYLIKGIFIPAGYSFEMQPAQPLKAGAIIKVSSSVDNTLDLVGSITTIVKTTPLLISGIGIATTSAYTAPTGGVTIMRLYFANTTSANLTVNISYFDSSASITVYQSKSIVIPNGNTFAINAVQPLDSGDILKISSSVDGSIDVTGSYM